MKKISVIVSCYNEEKSLPYFYEEISKISKQMSKKVEFEYIFVNDGSKDQTLKVLKEFKTKDKRCDYISFSRNFGKEAAMYAGIVNSTGDYVTFMDADLQHPPKYLIEMYDYIVNEGYDSVAMVRKDRKGESKIKSFFSNLFYKVINKLSKIEMVAGAGDYRLFTRQVANEIINICEYNRYSKGIFSFIGFDTKYIEYNNVERVAGQTKWSFTSLFKYAVEGIVSYSTAPLKISTFIGFVCCILSLVAMVYIFFRTLFFGDAVPGWPTMICIMLFLGGIQLFCMGIQSEYIAKSYQEIKNRPIYIVKETSINEKN